MSLDLRPAVSLQSVPMKRRIHLLILTFLVISLSSALVTGTVSFAAERDNPAMVPVPQTAAWWTVRHEQVLARSSQGAVDLLMIGDSITQGWDDEGRPVWNEYYERRSTMNLGFNTDRTEHVLWRLRHGEIEGLAPKVAVVMIGTNNTGASQDLPEDTAAGIQAILTTLRARLPGTKILLLGIFPCGASADDPFRRVNVAINNRLHELADAHHVFYLDLSQHFLDHEGRLRQDLLPDLLHPNERGYRVWAEGMEAMLKQLLDE